MQQPKHWQDMVNAVLGLWVIISPWVLGFDGSSMAMSNAVIVGVLLVATALGAAFVPRAWEEWTEAGIGLWLVVSPWILGFSGHRNAMLSTVISRRDRPGAGAVDAVHRQGLQRRVPRADGALKSAGQPRSNLKTAVPARAFGRKRTSRPSCRP